MLGFLALIMLVIRWLPRLDKPQQNITKYETIVLGFILLIGIAAIYGRFFLGDAYYAYRDMGDDTVNQYVPAGGTWIVQSIVFSGDGQQALVEYGNINIYPGGAQLDTNPDVNFIHILTKIS